MCTTTYYDNTNKDNYNKAVDYLKTKQIKNIPYFPLLNCSNVSYSTFCNNSINYINNCTNYQELQDKLDRCPISNTKIESQRLLNSKGISSSTCNSISNIDFCKSPSYYIEFCNKTQVGDINSKLKNCIINYPDFITPTEEQKLKTLNISLPSRPTINCNNVISSDFVCRDPIPYINECLYDKESATKFGNILNECNDKPYYTDVRENVIKGKQLMHSQYDYKYSCNDIIRDNLDIYYTPSTPVLGRDVIPRDCKLSISSTQVCKDTSDNGIQYVYPINTITQPVAGGRDCNTVLQDTYPGYQVYLDPKIGNYIMPSNFNPDAYTSLSQCDSYNAPYVRYGGPTIIDPNAVSPELFKYKESFALPSNTFTSPSDLSPSDYYLVGTLKPNTFPPKTPGLYGGDYECAPYPSTIYTKVFSSPSEATSDGFYWYRSGSMTNPVQLFTRVNLVDGRNWVRVFSSPFASTATVNEIGKNIPFTGFLIQNSPRPSGGFSTLINYSYFSTPQLFNTRNSTALTTGGNKPGFAVYIGFAGGHGFYNPNL
jgi:hypothetical protein